MDELKGSIVISLAGRDKGRLFMVTEDVDDQFVLLADGHLRRLEKPKLKKRKHVRAMHALSEHFKDKVKDGPLTNARLRKEIKALSDDMVKAAASKEG